MNSTKYILHSAAVLAVVALATACSSEDELTDKSSGVKETVTLTAYQPNTRVGFDKYGEGYWQAGDEIGVWSTGDNKFCPFAIKSGTGEASATFSGTVTDGVGQYAVYPYNENHNISGTTLTYYLPNKYTYTSVDQDFFTDGNDGNSFGMPMLGTISDDDVVSFKHLGGVICIKVDKMPAESGTVIVTESAKNKLSGNFTANLSDATPEISTTWSTTYNAVTFIYSGATADASGVFYLPVATGSYNLTIEVFGDKKASTTTSVCLTMTRAKLQVVNVATNYTESSASSDGSKIINGHKFIDLGLPSGLLWAETNIGAETAYDDGYYYAWGETSPKEKYELSTYTLCTYKSGKTTYTKYTSEDKKTDLDKEDDAAYVNWGSSCRMPTQREMEELTNSDNCTWAWVGRTNSAGETINCYKVVSKKNNNVIYLPASGMMFNTYRSDHNMRGIYRSSTLYYNVNAAEKVSSAYVLDTNCEYYEAGHNLGRCTGFSVRPVAKP